jgi:hypothetical protein
MSVSFGDTGASWLRLTWITFEDAGLLPDREQFADGLASHGPRSLGAEAHGSTRNHELR